MTTRVSASFVERVRHVVGDRARRALRTAARLDKADLLLPGKMLRTRLAARLVAHHVAKGSTTTLAAVCAATEMAHTASLCHDDVIDCAALRRAKPTLWRVTSPSGAVLIGDLLLCEAMDLLAETEGGRRLPSFVSKFREVCIAEAEQELEARGRPLDERTCLDIARRKTGPLFAFVCGACGGEDEAFSSALEEAGYRIGTAYQLADDWVDVVGDERITGKTLGTDAQRAKFTLAQTSTGGQSTLHAQIARLCHSALECLEACPGE